MDTFKLKALLTAIEKGSMAKASKEFAYTPSALSHCINSLETELGVILLTRTPKGVALSKEGIALKEKIDNVLKAEKEFFETVKIIKNKKNEQLRIGTYSSVSSELLPKLLNGFIEKHPDISISIAVGNYLRDWLDTDKADILLANEVEGKEWLPVLKDDYFAVVPDTEFLGRNSVKIEELTSYPFIMTDNKIGEIDLEEVGFEEIIKLDSDSYEAAISMVKEKIGVAILPSLILKKRSKGIRILKINPGVSRVLGVVYNKTSPTKNSTMQFVEYLSSQLKR